MARTRIIIGSCVLLGMLACQSPADTGKQQANAKKAATKSGPPAKVEAATCTEGRAATARAGRAAAATGRASPPVEPVEPPPVEPPPTDPNATWKPPPGADIRSDAVVPPGTPAANAEAFKKLPVAKGVDRPWEASAPTASISIR